MSIKNKIVLFYILSSAVTVFAIIGILVYKAYEFEYTNSSRQNTQTLTYINKYIESVFHSTQQNARMLATAPEVDAARHGIPDFTRATEPTKVLRSQMDEETQELDKLLERIVQTHPSYLAAGVGLETGQYTEFPPSTFSPGYDPRKRGWYQGIMAAGTDVSVSPAYLSTAGDLVCGVTAKMKDARGAAKGVALLEIKLTSLVEMISSVRLYDTGYLVLLEDSGTILADPRHKEALFKKIGDGVIPGLAGAMQLKDGTTVIRMGEQENQVTVLTGFHGWKLLAIVPQDEVYASVTEMVRFVGLTGFVILCLAGLASWGLARSISTPIVCLAQTSEALAQGRLDTPPPHAAMFTGEMKILHCSFFTMVDNLKQMLEKARLNEEDSATQTAKAQKALAQAEIAGQEIEKKNAHILSAAQHLEQAILTLNATSDALAGQIGRSKEDASRQAARITETAAAMEEMNSTVLDIARNAGQASEASALARQKAESGAEVVQMAISGIQTVRDQALKLKEDMAQLDESARAINQIMSVISDIADQTNLLALNAAIEAARAGEAGRGFAVVADEVRKLAEKTMTSTAEVDRAITAIQGSTKQSMVQMDAAANSIEEATQLINQSGGSLQEIVQMVDSTADQVRAIATAAEEQSATSDEINRSIADVNEIAGTTVDTMRQAADAVVELGRQSHDLKGLVQDMKMH